MLKKKKFFIEEEQQSIPNSSVKVSILNGCGYPGIATEAKEKLLDFEQIDVISWKNNFRNMYIYDQTIIIVKKDNDKKLDYLMKITGIERRALAYNENIIEEFYIILGKDYRKYFK
ncbi:MAG: LytR C-terminal domain-containing protein [Candidatus Cloacimonetes bacterium]|nr:LytR C-terminal domain-containing protein [Candidatus Cloacimonadota bacterium]